MTSPVADIELPPAPAAALAPPAADRKRLLTLAVGHAVTDTYGNSLLAPMFPVLAAQLRLTMADIGGLTALMGIASSLGQPVWGYLSDRWPRLCMVAIGPAVAAVCCTCVGLAPNYATLAVLLVFTGFGIGAFHPQGAALARQAGRGSGLAMSVFTVGGNIGYGIAPLLGALYLWLVGLPHLYVAAVPGLAVAALLAVRFAGQPASTPRHGAACGEPPGGATNTPALVVLTGTVVLRSAVQIGMVTFLPFLVGHRFPTMDPTAARGAVVSVFLLASAISGPIGGHLSDRLGRKPVMAWSFLLAPWPLLLAFQLPGGWFLASLALGGFLLMLPHPANVVMAQEYMPRSAGIAASMITGLAWGLAQLMASPLGVAAERFGTEPALMGLSLLPLLGAGLVLGLPEERKS